MFLVKTLEEEVVKMNSVVSDFVYFHKQLSITEISYKDNQDFSSNKASKERRRNSVLPSTNIQDRRNSSAIVSSGQELNNNINGTNNNVMKQNGQNSLYTLIFHGLQEDWMEQVKLPMKIH